VEVAFEHPENAALLAYLERSWDGRAMNRSASPEVYDLYSNSLGTHPDLAQRLWSGITTELPEPAGWVVFGRPVLVHPRSGILFGFAEGTHAYALRLPAPERAEALAAGASRVFSYPRGASLSLEALGPEWVFGRWFDKEPAWCLAGFRFAG
jgi:hypothetical protein